MNEQTTETTKEFEQLDKILSDTVDKEILGELEYYLGLVREKSRALASSLKRCFDNAKKSLRFVLVYKLGKEDAKKNETDIDIENEDEIKKYLEQHLKEYFEQHDFMHYREFIRLLRACTIDAGGDISFHIKNMYNNFFLGKRLIKAYLLGLKIKD